MPLVEAKELVCMSNVGAGPQPVNPGVEFLSDLSPRHTPWDTHRAESDEVGVIYGSSIKSHHQRYAGRITQCSQTLQFARDPPTRGKTKLKLKNAFFCRVRFCPVCQWRRALKYQAIVYSALPLLIKDYPDTRFLFLTLTIRNCEIHQLRATLDLMRRAWVRLTQLRTFPARGWVRTVEITRSQRDRSAHPHYHALLMVAPAYFQGDYLKQNQWAELWQQCLRINYRPVVDIRVVKLTLVPTTGRVNTLPKNLWAAVAEILKYAVKPSDMIRDHDWFLALSDQLVKTRAVAVGGILKRYLKAQRRGPLTEEPGETEPSPSADSLFFGWKPQFKRYRRIDT